MKAAVYDHAGPPDVLRYAEVSDPVCKAGEVMIRVEAIAIEGGDLFARNSVRPATPGYIGGYSAAGTIVEIASNDLGWAIGDRVATVAVGGSHAELRAVPALGCYRVPPGLDSARAAAVPIPFLTAHQALFQAARLQAEEWVLVQGAAGSVGLAAVQLAARHGATVLAVQGGSARIARLRELGATRVIDRRSENVVEAVKQATEGRMASVVLDPVGGATLDVSIACAQPFGRVLLVGNASQVSMRPDLWPAMTTNVALLGVSLRASFNTRATKEAAEKTLEQVRNGELEVILDRTFSLREAAAAHRYSEEGSVLGRVILQP